MLSICDGVNMIDHLGGFLSFSSPLVLTVLGIGLGVLILYFVPKIQVAKIHTSESKGPLDLENDYRQTLVQIVGGIAIIATVYGAIENARVSREAITLSARSYDLARQGQVADRTFKAMDMLSKEKNMDAKLAAIYALGELAAEEPKAEWQITETLFNYAKFHSNWTPSAAKRSPKVLAADIAAIGEYLSRRPYKTQDGECIEKQQCWDYETQNRPSEHDVPGYFGRIINLPHSDLRHIFLEGAMLKTANLDHSHLENSFLRHAHGENVYGLQAHFNYSDLSDSHWRFANLKDADFTEAQLCRTHFEHVYAEGANYMNADLSDSHWDNPAKFRKSNLRNANLNCSVWNGADMDDLFLDGATLYGADLRRALHLTKQQLEKTQGDNTTKLSDDSLRPSSWSRGSMQCPQPTSLHHCPPP
jgi:uncharacterized protein YjbI with pentapeptide repeats